MPCPEHFIVFLLTLIRCACAGNWRTSPNHYASPARVYSDPGDNYVGQYAQEEDDGQSLDDEVSLALAVMSRSRYQRGVAPTDFGSDCACGCCMCIAQFSAGRKSTITDQWHSWHQECDERLCVFTRNRLSHYERRCESQCCVCVSAHHLPPTGFLCLSTPPPPCTHWCTLLEYYWHLWFRLMCLHVQNTGHSNGIQSNSTDTQADTRSQKSLQRTRQTTKIVLVHELICSPPLIYSLL